MPKTFSHGTMSQFQDIVKKKLEEISECSDSIMSSEDTDKSSFADELKDRLYSEGISCDVYPEDDCFLIYSGTNEYHVPYSDLKLTSESMDDDLDYIVGEILDREG